MLILVARRAQRRVHVAWRGEFLADLLRLAPMCTWQDELSAGGVDVATPAAYEVEWVIDGMQGGAFMQLPTDALVRTASCLHVALRFGQQIACCHSGLHGCRMNVIGAQRVNRPMCRSHIVHLQTREQPLPGKLALRSALQRMAKCEAVDGVPGVPCLWRVRPPWQQRFDLPQDLPPDLVSLPATCIDMYSLYGNPLLHDGLQSLLLKQPQPATWIPNKLQFHKMMSCALWWRQAQRLQQRRAAGRSPAASAAALLREAGHPEAAAFASSPGPGSLAVAELAAAAEEAAEAPQPAEALEETEARLPPGSVKHGIFQVGDMSHFWRLQP